jgi:hypothetical protein
VDEREKAIAAIDEQVPVPWVDSRRAQRPADQFMERGPEFGLPRIGAADRRQGLGHLAFAPAADLVQCRVAGHHGRDSAAEVAPQRPQGRLKHGLRIGRVVLLAQHPA